MRLVQISLAEGQSHQRKLSRAEPTSALMATVTITHCSYHAASNVLCSWPQHLMRCRFVSRDPFDIGLSHFRLRQYFRQFTLATVRYRIGTGGISCCE